MAGQKAPTYILHSHCLLLSMYWGEQPPHQKKNVPKKFTINKHKLEQSQTKFKKLGLFQMFWCFLPVLTCPDLPWPALTILFPLWHVQTWPVLTNPYQSWPVLTRPDWSWSFLTIPDNSWQFMTISDHSWPSLTSPDQFWQILTNPDHS